MRRSGVESGELSSSTVSSVVTQFPVVHPSGFVAWPASKTKRGQFTLWKWEYATPLSLPLISHRLCLTCYSQRLKWDRDPFRHYGYRLLLVYVYNGTARGGLHFRRPHLCGYAATIREVPYLHSSRPLKISGPRKSTIGLWNLIFVCNKYFMDTMHTFAWFILLAKHSLAKLLFTVL